MFFSIQELPKARTREWRSKIIEAIRHSACFVPIYTRHSLRREWVLYESGIADACKLHRLPARVASVSPSEIADLPSPGAYVYDLSEKDLLARLIINVCIHDGEDEGIITPKVYNVVQESPLAERICQLSRTRWVFVAGNYPENAALPNSGLNWFTTRQEYLDRLKRFCEMLTEILFDKGFSVSASPQVEAVGMHVITKAVDYLDNVKHLPHVDFAIGGIHPIDREARKSSLSETARRKWLDHIMEFRKSYLSNQEWLVLIGGNEGTNEEYDAAKKSKVKIMPIPCFGGTAAIIYSRASEDITGPCVHCAKRNGLCETREIEQIVLALKGSEA